MRDLTLSVESGYLNIRVGAIIQRDGQLLMARSHDYDYYYSIGGRVQFGETTEDAIRREVFEETGYELSIERLGFIEEDYYYADGPKYGGKLIYEISFFYYMKVPNDFSPQTGPNNLNEEYVDWIDPIHTEKIIPAFFRTEVIPPLEGIRHYILDQR